MDYLFGGAYDKCGLDNTWRTVLHNQFHDILPGSSIREVYEHTDRDYLQVHNFLKEMQEKKAESLADKIASDGGILAINTLGFDRPLTVNINGATFETDATVPSYGWCVFNGELAKNTVVCDKNRIENDFYVIKLDNSGRITSLFDKEAEREVFSDKANEIQIFDDFPDNYDAWEIRESDMHKYTVLDTPQSAVPFEKGTVKGVEITYGYGSSTVKTVISLYSKTKRIDFDFKAEWHEKHKLVKIAFPFDIHANEAEYDIQFGSVKRPTHKNTSWDSARFEVCAHKWVDIREEMFGAALINDCKYGFSADGSTVKLTALRCPDYPDKTADEGLHEFRYALFTHGDGDEYIKESYIFNQPLVYKSISAHAGTLPAKFSLVKVESSNGFSTGVIAETVKRAEDGGDMILRLYESRNGREKVKIKTGEKFLKAFLCDLNENNEKELEIKDGCTEITVKSYEIITLRFVR